MDSVKLLPGPPCPALLRPAGGSLSKRPYGRFGGGPPAGKATCGRLHPFWPPHTVRLWLLRCAGAGLHARSGDENDDDAAMAIHGLYEAGSSHDGEGWRDGRRQWTLRKAKAWCLWCLWRLRCESSLMWYESGPYGKGYPRTP
jgi:hypothetical protein